MTRIRVTVIPILLLAFLILSGCTPATPTTVPEPPATEEPTEVAATSTPEPVELKVGYIPYTSYLPFFIAQEEGYYAEQNLVVELIKFGRQSDAIPMLISGDIDIYAGPLDTMVLNAIVQGGEIKFVADKGYNNPTGCIYTAWIARQDIYESGVLDDLNNLRGMKIGFNKTQTAEYGLDLILGEVGMTSADIEIMDLSAPDRVAGITNGSIDIVFLSEPFLSQVVTSGAGTIWRAWETTMPDFQLAMLMYGKTMFENPDAGNRFMVAYLKAVRQYMEGTTPRNAQLMAAFLESTPEEVVIPCWQSLRTDGSIDTQSILDYIDWAVARGYMLSALTEEQFWDPSFIEYANDVLK